MPNLNVPIDLSLLRALSMEALKQDKTGYILTLSVHPNDVPIELLRDFVGARYQVVMVRIGDDEQPLNREQSFPDPVKTAGIMCRDKKFQQFLIEIGEVFEGSEDEVVQWMKDQLGINSRTELRTNEQARNKLYKYQEDFRAWQNV